MPETPPINIISAPEKLKLTFTPAASFPARTCRGSRAPALNISDAAESAYIGGCHDLGRTATKRRMKEQGDRFTPMKGAKQ
jgi:hypothetical protein